MFCLGARDGLRASHMLGTCPWDIPLALKKKVVKILVQVQKILMPCLRHPLSSWFSYWTYSLFLLLFLATFLGCSIFLPLGWPQVIGQHSLGAVVFSHLGSPWLCSTRLSMLPIGIEELLLWKNALLCLAHTEVQACAAVQLGKAPVGRVISKIRVSKGHLKPQQEEQLSQGCSLCRNSMSPGEGAASHSTLWARSKNCSSKAIWYAFSLLSLLITLCVSTSWRPDRKLSGILIHSRSLIQESNNVGDGHPAAVMTL